MTGGSDHPIVVAGENQVTLARNFSYPKLGYQACGTGASVAVEGAGRGCRRRGGCAVGAHLRISRRRQTDRGDHLHGPGRYRLGGGRRPDPRAVHHQAGRRDPRLRAHPGDMRRSAKADLIVDNGLNLESWFSQFVEPLDVEHVVISDGVKPIDITSDAYAGKPNPHAWMSPLNVEIHVDNLVRAFTGIDPGGAVAFQANAVAYKKQLRQVHDDLVAALRTVPEKQRALVTCEGAFPYLTRDAGSPNTTSGR